MKAYKKYCVAVSAHGNPDHGQNPNAEVAIGGFVFADTIEQCQDIVRRYIAEHDLGAGNWTGGAVYEDGVQIGQISYNGRYWPKDEQ